MPPKVSLISDVGVLTIGRGSFSMNVRQTTVRKGLEGHDFNKLCSVLDSANAKQNEELGNIVESRIQKLSKKLEDHQNEVSSVVQRVRSPLYIEGSVHRNTAYALLSRVQQMARLLPIAHLDLARQFAGTVWPHTSARSFGDNLIVVGGPLLSSSIFSTFPAEVQFMVFYFLAAMIFVELFHPRLLLNNPRSRVNVLDALGKYHDFPWSACENLMTFHAEFLRRFLNQTGFSFVKSKLYEVEYNGSIMKPDDWATIKPFTDLFVNFIQIQRGGQAQVVKCPWCGSENPLPSVSEESTTECSYSECGRDFSTAVGSSTDEGSDQHTLLPGLDKTISVEILRCRIRLRTKSHRSSPGKRSLLKSRPSIDLFLQHAYPDLAEQLDLWTSLSFELDDPLAPENNEHEIAHRLLADEDEARSPVTKEKAISDGHANVVTPTNVNNPNRQLQNQNNPALINPAAAVAAAAAAAAAAAQSFDLNAFLAGFGLDSFAAAAAAAAAAPHQHQPQVQQPQSQPQVITPSLAQLLALHSVHNVGYPPPPPGFLPYPLPPVDPSAAPPAPHNAPILTSNSEESYGSTKRSRTRRSSITVSSPEDGSPSSGTAPTPNTASASASPPGLTPLSPSEDKRRRNTAASARFRLKKKEREAALETKAKELESKVVELERECEALRRENGWLKGLVVGVTGAAAQAPTGQGLSPSGTKRSREESGSV